METLCSELQRSTLLSSPASARSSREVRAVSARPSCSGYSTAARAHLGGISSIPDEEWLDALDLNYLSAVRVNNALLPALREAGAGSVIVNISSGERR
jgi:NAD(P)-dependent dehydrogenase (short-subunit alcohol dehydrogenase family)